MKEDYRGAVACKMEDKRKGYRQVQITTLRAVDLAGDGCRRGTRSNRVLKPAAETIKTVDSETTNRLRVGFLPVRFSGFDRLC